MDAQNKQTREKWVACGFIASISDYGSVTQLDIYGYPRVRLGWVGLDIDLGSVGFGLGWI